jgi:hypothetical protein
LSGTRAIVKQIPGLRAGWLDEEAEIYFPPDALDQVAEMAGARKKRQGRKLTAAEKSNLLEAGKSYRYKNKTTGLQVENPDQF